MDFNFDYIRKDMLKRYKEQGDEFILRLGGEQYNAGNIPDDKIEYFIKRDNFPDNLLYEILLDIKSKRRTLKLLQIKNIINDNRK